MSANGKEKIVAKVQHFYEELVRALDNNKDKSIMENSAEKRSFAAHMMNEYFSLANSYQDLFKEFLHAEPNDA